MIGRTKVQQKAESNRSLRQICCVFTFCPIKSRLELLLKFGNQSPLKKHDQIFTFIIKPDEIEENVLDSQCAPANGLGRNQGPTSICNFADQSAASVYPDSFKPKTNVNCFREAGFKSNKSDVNARNCIITYHIHIPYTG